MTTPYNIIDRAVQSGGVLAASHYDVPSFRKLLGRLITPFQMRNSFVPQPHVMFAHRALHRTAIMRVAHPFSTELQAPANGGYYVLHIINQGQIAWQSTVGTVTVGVGQAVLVHPDTVFNCNFSRESDYHLFRLERRWFEARWRNAGATDRIPRPVVSVVDLQDGAGIALGHFTRFMASDQDLNDFGVATRLPIDSLEEMLAINLARGLAEATGQTRRRSFAGVDLDRTKRACRYIEDNLSASLSVSEIANVAGVTPRTLHTDFVQRFGLGPKAYVTRARLQAARNALETGRSDATVSAVALAHGIDHLGRFAAAYRKTFGESPSVTLRSAQRFAAS